MQLKSDGLTNIGTVAIGQGSSFSYRFSSPFDFNTNTNDTYLFDADSDIYDSEKYHHYQNISNVRNFREQYLGTQNYITTANFNPTFAGVTIQNIFSENPSLSPTDDIIQFKDPWLIDYYDPQHGYKKRNRGQNDAIFQNLPSPFYPDYTTAYNSNTYRGIFLDQIISSGSYYSVRSPIQQPNDIFITQTGKYHKFYFYNWSSTGTDPLTQNNIVTGYYETPVVFRSNSAAVQANLKGTQLSNDATAYSNSSQRKFIQTPDGVKHICYESMDRVWYELSTDGGSTWILGNGGKPLSNVNSKKPSMSFYGNNIAIVWQEQSSSSFKIKIALFWMNDYSSSRFGTVADEDASLDYSYNANPVIAWGYNSKAVVVWSGFNDCVNPFGEISLRYAYSDVSNYGVS